MSKKRKISEAALTISTRIKVRFSEVDSMRVVWHGQYVRYFEDGREAFGEKYGLSYSSIYDNGYTAPIVDLTCQYKAPLTFGEEAVVEARYIATDAAKILFEYTIYQGDGVTVAAIGSTMQVFLNSENDNKLELVNPQFYLDWKKRWNI